MKATDFITAKDCITLEKTGHVIHLMPRKMLVEIDGYKKYKVNTCTLETIKYWRKTGFMVK